MNDPEVNSYMSNERIKWSFIKELSPWMGGFYERLVGTTKMALKKSIGKQKLTSIQLQTTLAEVEAILNSRPLTYVGDDINDQNVLTPQHFLSLKTNHGLPDVGDKDEDLNDPDYLQKKDSASTLLETWKKGNRYLNEFWDVWRNQYLTSLRERSQITMKHPRVQASKEASIGDIVQIKDNTARGTWKIGKIVELIKSQDGIVRAAKVKTPTNTVLQRSLVHLYPLECEDRQKFEIAQEPEGVKKANTNIQEQRPTRPRRKAAENARDKILAQELQNKI